MTNHGWEIYGVPANARQLATKYADLKDRNLGEVVGEALMQYLADKLSPAMMNEILLDRPQEATAGASIRQKG